MICLTRLKQDHSPPRAPLPPCAAEPAAFIAETNFHYNNPRRACSSSRRCRYSHFTQLIRLEDRD